VEGGLKIGAFAGALRLFGVKERRRCEARPYVEGFEVIEEDEYRSS
jgi:hypothetical protein